MIDFRLLWALKCWVIMLPFSLFFSEQIQVLNEKEWILRDNYFLQHIFLDYKGRVRLEEGKSSINLEQFKVISLLNKPTLFIFWKGMVCDEIFSKVFTKVKSHWVDVEPKSIKS